METTLWKAIYDEIACSEDDTGHIVSKPTAKQLRSLETAFDCNLPDDYRGFIQTFGAGELSVDDADNDSGLGMLFRFYSPGCENPSFEMVQHISALREAIDEGSVPYYRSLRDHQLIQRLIFFARDFRGDEYGWDPADCTNDSNPDFRVHWWPRLTTQTLVLAPSFKEFIAAICWGDAYFNRFFKRKGIEVAPRISAVLAGKAVV
jgi:SMI1/KNR4 family protein SUKH-1